MRIGFHPEWVFHANSEEARLILRALGGRLKGEKEVEEAKALGDNLTKQRAAQAAAYLREMEKHASHVVDDACN